MLHFCFIEIFIASCTYCTIQLYVHNVIRTCDKQSGFTFENSKKPVDFKEHL